MENEIASLGYEIVVESEVKGAYTKTGLIGGKHCSICNKVIAKQNVIPALILDIEYILTVDYSVKIISTEKNICNTNKVERLDYHMML